MKLNENFAEILISEKEHIFNSDVFMATDSSNRRFNGKHESILWGGLDDRYNAALFQVEESDFVAPLSYYKESRRKPQEEIIKMIENKDLYLNTDFLDTEQSKRYLDSSEEKYFRFQYQMKPTVPDLFWFSIFIRNTLGTNCGEKRKRDIQRFIDETWREDLLKLGKVKEVFNVLRDFWRAKRFAELNSEAEHHLLSALRSSKTVDSLLETVDALKERKN